MMACPTCCSTSVLRPIKNGGNELHHCQEAAGRFVVARGQAAKLLEATEKALDFAAVAISVTVNQAVRKPILFARNFGFRPQRGHAGQHGIRVIARIGQHVARTLNAGQ